MPDPQPEQLRRAQPAEHREAAALLAAGITRARSGTGGLVLLRGATGTGRTSVLEGAAEAAAAQGVRVLRARCSPGWAAAPFAAVLQLLGPVPGSERTDPAGDEREQAALLRHALRSYAGESPLLLAVDDVHLADGPSYRWLVEAARHVDRLPLPILLAVTERSQYDIDPSAPGFTHTLSPALVDTHTLSPLTPDAAAGLVRAEHPDAPTAWVESCVRAGAGSPLLLRALLDDLSASAGYATDVLLPYPDLPEASAALYQGSYVAAVQWWLDSAGNGTAEVARALAVLEEGWERAEGGAGAGGGEAPAGLLGELAGADPARVAGWLTAMT
ncbi:ATP-binding protein, partial [Streptomyces violarus]|uniref:ATP-binding protein n=1 Tax=Streptomyces violarus TaxID=67380 RepID=UPI0021BFD7E2